MFTVAAFLAVAPMGLDLSPECLQQPGIRNVRLEAEWPSDDAVLRFKRQRAAGGSETVVVDTASGEMRVLDAGGNDEPLQADTVLGRSRDLGGETELTLVNRSGRLLSVWWVDRTGERQGYGTVAPGSQHVQHIYHGHVFLLTDTDGAPVAAYTATSVPAKAVITRDTRAPRVRTPRPPAAEDANRDAADTGARVPIGVPAPRGGHAVFVRDHDLWLRRSDGTEQALAEDGDATHSFRQDMVRARAIGMAYDRPDAPAWQPSVHWSPDGRFLLALQTTVVPEPRVTLVESSPSDQVQPRVHSYPYLKAGDPIPHATVRLFDTAAARELPVDAALMQDPWSIGRFRWAADSRSVRFHFVQRGHQLERVLVIELRAQGDERDRFDAVTRVLVEERSETFLDGTKRFLRDLPGGDLLRTSERNGWNHLYLEPADGSGTVALTTGRWNVRGVERVDSDAVWFWAVGRETGVDPYLRQLCRVPLDGGPIVQLTDGDGDHEVQWSPGRRFFVDSWSRADLPPRHVLRSANDGALVASLVDAEVTGLDESGWRLPEPFVAPGRDGRAAIHGLIHYPKDFDPALAYPVLESIYAGPHGAHVPKRFSLPGRGGTAELLARGFVVVQIDGMGTNWRGKAFHDVAWKNLKDAGFFDRIAWMRAAAAAHPWMDLSRVGVYGGSAGGQNAMRAVLDHADFYRAAAADCGCHDNRMDKIWWNEQWMGLPGDGSYVASSNVEDAHKLGGALLLTVGELDRNVDPASTYQVVAALQRAEKDFEFQVFPGRGHGAGGSPYGRRVRADFFTRILGGPQ
jgi:dipeptidyl aminopeptidase/acylaminoacyl peptidase